MFLSNKRKAEQLMTERNTADRFVRNRSAVFLCAAYMQTTRNPQEIFPVEIFPVDFLKIWLLSQIFLLFLVCVDFLRDIAVENGNNVLEAKVRTLVVLAGNILKLGVIGLLLIRLMIVGNRL